MEPDAPVRPLLLEKLPPFPAIAAQLLRLVSQESASFQQVARLIQADAAFAAEVLRLANSALLGLRHPVGNILQAITFLGADRLKGLVLTVAMRDFLYGVRHHVCLHRCWRHNLACALVADWLSEPCWQDRGACYTAGLLHDIGRLALVASDPERYGQILATPGLDAAAMLAEERRVLDLDHCQVGGWLVKDWNLPEHLVEVIVGHHANAVAGEASVRNLVTISCRLADQIGFAVADFGGVVDADWVRAAVGDSAWSRLSGQLESLPETVAFKINAFECDFFLERRRPPAAGRLTPPALQR